MQVFCRFRPCFADELPAAGAGDADLIAVAGDSRSVQVAALEPGTDSGLASTSQAGADYARTSVTEFCFQHVFQPGASQAQVFERIVQPLACAASAAAESRDGGQKGDLVEQILCGQNATICAYGQTGTGKTYSVEGPSAAMVAALRDPSAGPAGAAVADLVAGSSAEEGAATHAQTQTDAQSAHELRGLIPRLVESLFSKLAQRAQQQAQAADSDQDQAQAQALPEVEVSVSYFELYRGKIRDLLAGGKSLYTDAAEEESGANATATASASTTAAPSRSVSPGPAAFRSPSPAPESGQQQRALQLQVRDKQVVVAGLCSRAVRDARAVLRLLREGQRFRTVARTNANATSSRGHAIFDVCVKQVVRVAPASAAATAASAESASSSADGADPSQPQTLPQTQAQAQSHTLVSRLRLVDLAGSEQHLESGQEPARLEEARSINRSLTSLAKVIHALAARLQHVSYRDSTLTRLLAQSLGPQANCATLLLITCSPARQALRKTLNTLRFGAHASAIVNAVRVNARRRSDSVSLSAFALPAPGVAGSGAVGAAAAAGGLANAAPAQALSLEERPCWDRLQELQARDGALRQVPLEFVRGLLAAAAAASKTPATRKVAHAHGGPSSPPTAAAAAVSSSEVRIQLHALQAEFEAARAHHAREVAHLRGLDQARAVAAGQNLAVQQRLRRMDRALRAFLQRLARAGFVSVFLREAAATAAASAAGDGPDGPDDGDEPRPAPDPAAEAEALVQLSQWEGLLASSRFDARADGEAPPPRRCLSPLAMLRGLVERFPPQMRLDSSGTDAAADVESRVGAARGGRGGVASPLRKGRPADASPARSSGSGGNGDHGPGAGLQDRIAQLQAQNESLQAELERLHDPDAFPLQARVDALQLELDAGYGEIVRTAGENDDLRAEILRLRGAREDSQADVHARSGSGSDSVRDRRSNADALSQSREEERERAYRASVSELRRAHAAETSSLLALLDESAAEARPEHALEIEGGELEAAGASSAGGTGSVRGRVSSATVRALVEARVAVETAELRAQLALARADLARDGLLPSASAESPSNVGATDGSSAARSRSGVNRQLFHSPPLQGGHSGGGSGGDTDRSLHTLAEGRESAPSSASPSPNRTHAHGLAPEEEDERVSAAVARRSAALERDFAAMQARWLQEKEHEFADAIAAASASATATAAAEPRGGPALSPREFSRGMTTPSPSAHARPSFDAADVASSPDTAELASALSEQLAAEKGAYAAALRWRLEAEQADWAGQLEERQRATVDARVQALEARAAAAVEALTADTARKLRDHHDRLEARMRRAQTKADQAAELKKLQWQDEAVREFQKRQAKEKQQDDARQRDLASPSSSARGGRGAEMEEEEEEEERQERSAAQRSQVRLALLEADQADLAAREQRLRDWRARVEADEAARNDFEAHRNGQHQRQHEQQQQQLGSSNEPSALDQVRQAQAEYEQLLSQERAAHAAELESVRARASQSQSGSVEVDSGLAAQIAPSLAALQARFAADKADWMERSKRAMDAELARRVLEEKARVRVELEASVPAAVQAGLAEALERERGAWAAGAQRQFAAAVQQEADRAAQAAAAQCSIMSAEAAANAQRWSEREEAFNRTLADQAAHAAAELSRVRAAHEERERDLLSRTALASSLSASAANDHGREHRELERAFQQRQEALQAQFEARLHAQLVAPLQRENRSLAERARMLQALLQQREERDKITSMAQGAAPTAAVQSFAAHAQSTLSADFFRSDKPAEVEQRPRRSEEKEHQEDPPTSSRAGAAAASSPDPSRSRAPGSSLTTIPTSRQTERAAIQAQIARLDEQLHEAQFSPGRGRRAGNNSYSSDKPGGWASPSRSHNGASQSFAARTPAASPSGSPPGASAASASPSPLLSHLEQAGPSDYPFGSPSAHSVHWVARLQAHQASETAAHHVAHAQAHAQGGLSFAADQSLQHHTHLFSSPLAPNPHPLLAAPFVDHLERELYASHQSFLAAEMSALVSKAAVHGGTANLASNAQPVTPAKAAAPATATVATDAVGPYTPPRESDARPAPRTDGQLSRVEVELQRAQANIQLLVDAARDAAPAAAAGLAAASAANAGQTLSGEQLGVSPDRRTLDIHRSAADPDPRAVAAAGPSAAAATGTEAAAGLSSNRLESAMASLQAELGATTRLLHSERRRHAEADQLEQTLLAHALVHSVPTPPRSPPTLARAPAAAPAVAAVPISLRSPWAATVRLPAGFTASASPAPMSHSASPLAGRSLLHGDNANSTAVSASAAAPPFPDPFGLSSPPLRLAHDHVQGGDPGAVDRAALGARTSDAHFTVQSSALRRAEARTEEARRRVQRSLAAHPARGAASGAASLSQGLPLVDAYGPATAAGHGGAARFGSHELGAAPLLHISPSHGDSAGGRGLSFSTPRLELAMRTPAGAAPATPHWSAGQR